MIVVDIGCHPQGPEESVHRLIERFEPQILFGFDPVPELEEGVKLEGMYASASGIGGTVVVRRRAAAWTHAGGIPFEFSGITSGLEQGHRPVESFDLAAFLYTLPPGEIVLKLDCEGAEYVLVPSLHASGADERLKLALIEWHPPETAHGLYRERVPSLRCPEEAW